MGLMSDTIDDAPLRYILQLEQRLQTLVEACIGIAKHRCKQLNFPAPENAYKAFERLAEPDRGLTQNSEHYHSIPLIP